MPISKMRFNGDVPRITACIDCSKRELYCHTNCEAYALEHIVAIAAESDAMKRKQRNYEDHDIKTRRIERGLYD